MALGPDPEDDILMPTLCVGCEQAASGLRFVRRRLETAQAYVAQAMDRMMAGTGSQPVVTNDMLSAHQAYGIARDAHSKAMEKWLERGKQRELRHGLASVVKP